MMLPTSVMKGLQENTQVQRELRILPFNPERQIFSCICNLGVKKLKHSRPFLSGPCRETRFQTVLSLKHIFVSSLAGVGQEATGTHHDGDPGGRQILLRRRLPPAISAQKPRWLLRPARHWCGLPRRQMRVPQWEHPWEPPVIITLERLPWQPAA